MLTTKLRTGLSMGAHAVYLAITIGNICTTERNESYKSILDVMNEATLMVDLSMSWS